jgi:hypothetical protein
MTVYVLNTLITPVNFDEVRTVIIVSYRLSLKEAKERVKKALERGELQSAVGHEGTAQLLSSLLGVEVKAERKTIFMKKGDAALQFFLKQRLPEGKVLSAEELQTLPYWLVWSEVREVEVEKND